VAKIRIRTNQDLAQACTGLCNAHEAFADAFAQTGLPPLRLRRPGFKGLARIVTSQQLSNQSAAAIWGRLEGTVTPFATEVFLQVPDQALRACGLSAGKIATLKGLAEAAQAGELDFDCLGPLSDDEVETYLCRFKGIGPWSAQIYLLACLGRIDVWPAGDLALQKAAQHLFGLTRLPDARGLAAMAEDWRPWRAVAARLLWAYYSAALRPPAGSKRNTA
jgi:DNA-3-methyladenine glycosylase II